MINVTNRYKFKLQNLLPHFFVISLCLPNSFFDGTLQPRSTNLIVGSHRICRETDRNFM
jgi:hypothetical protein